MMYLNYYAVLIAVAALFSYLPTYLCCPSPCRCDERRKTVYCNERNLKHVPYGIPLDTKTLLLQGNEIENSARLESVLGHLQLLERLDMYDNKLTSFPNNLPRTLVYLSLRLNFINVIGDGSISHLDNLRHLYLDSNNLADATLVSGLLKEANLLEDLTLSSNFLNLIPDGLPKSLRNFRISHNNISQVSLKQVDNLSNLLVLDLSYNKIGNDELDLNPLQSLRTLDLSHNRLVNLPSELPTNLTELRISSNAIQYIYSRRKDYYGDLQSLQKLKKLDLCSNLLKSVEKGSFDNLPISVSVELQDNPWVCDCNLLYLKQWLTFTTSVLQPDEGLVRCASPSSFSEVTLAAMDVEALSCSQKDDEITIDDVQASYAVIDWSRNTEDPPFVTYSLMYGEMRCQNCSLDQDLLVSSDSKVTAWISEYTIAPIHSGIPKKLVDLKPSARYVVCVCASYRDPDQLTIDNCQVIQTVSVSLDEPTPAYRVIPLWLEIVTGVVISLVIGTLFVILIWCWRKRRRRDSTSFYFLGKSLSSGSGSSSNPKAGSPLVEANREFVTLVVRQDLNRESDSFYNDSQNESIPTNHIDAVSLREKNEIISRERNNLYETPLMQSMQHNNRLNKSVVSHDSGFGV